MRVTDLTTNPETAGVEPVAQFIESWCYEPDGMARENTCCVATACDIANAYRAAHPAPASNTTSVGEVVVERVARAIAQEVILVDQLTYETSGLSMDVWIEENWRDYKDAAIAAMPTSEAIRADERGRLAITDKSSCTCGRNSERTDAGIQLWGCSLCTNQNYRLGQKPWKYEPEVPITDAQVEAAAKAIATASGVSNWRHVPEQGDYDSRDYWRRLALAAFRSGSDAHKEASDGTA